jgi:hypothetical protein
VASGIEQTAGPVVERFASSSGRVLGFVGAGAGLLIAGAVVLSSGAREWGLLFFGITMALLAYVVLIRPVVIAHEYGVVLRNMLRDTYVPWTCIERARVLQTLHVVTDQGTYQGLGVSRSRRSMAKASRSALRSPASSAYPGGSVLGGGVRNVDETPGGTSYQTYVESRIEDLAVNARKKSETGQPLVAWALPPVLGLIAAAGCVLAMVLL